MRRMPAASFPVIDKADLFARLARGAQDGVSVVTPNRRLAQELAREFDADRIESGLHTWESADVIPFASFVERLWESAVYSDEGRDLPLLLSAPQEQALWEEIVTASEWGGELLSPARTASQCRDAWRLAHAWCIDGALGKFPGNDDADAFVQWAQTYAKRTQQEIDSARLPDAVAKLLTSPTVAKPRTLVAYGFDIVPAQLAGFFQAANANGIEVLQCAPRRKSARALRVAYPSAREELEASAQWARARLEEAHAASPARGGGISPRIAVVVPDLERRRQEVARVFSRVMVPGSNLPGAAETVMPFNISIGVALASYPLVHAALGMLALAAGEIDFPLASRLLRSPFIGGAEAELARRAQLDARLRKSFPARLTLVRLIASIETCPLLRQRLEAVYQYASANLARVQSPHAWARHFSEVLDAAGFPGERVLDSAEFQARVKWYEVLADFARIEHVVPRMTCGAALTRLRRLAADTLFQPESGAAPVQILGILESAGLEFDHLWVSGLTDDAWPLAARPNPFIPIALQKKAGIPEAAADSALQLDRRITADWLTAADEVVVSHPLREEDRGLLPSALIASIPEEKIELPRFARWRDLVHAARHVDTIPDGVAPPYAANEVRGGTRVLADQAACPFRAFARYRLRAEGLESPADGLDARDRGNLLHALMANLWGALRTRANLAALSPDELGSATAQAAAAAVAKVRAERPGLLDGRLAELERERLAKLASEWLEVERARDEFEVVAIEDKRTLEVAGLAFSGRIDRMDWLPQAKGGGHVLIDYKSGRATPNDWLNERPDDPQLPLYAIAAKEDVAAVVFAQMKTGGMRLMGFTRPDVILPKVKNTEAWGGLFETWKRELDMLAREFAGGVAVVRPKRELKTCRHCDLQPLCRVHERIAARDDEEEDGQE